MIEELKEKVERLEALFLRMVRVGIVTQVFSNQGTVRVKFDDQDGEVSYELPVIFKKTQKDKDYWLPDVGEQVLCVFLPYGIEQGFVLGAFYSEVDKPPVKDKNKRRIEFEDGSYVEYDRKEHKLTVEIKGEAEIKVEKDAKIEVSGNGELKVNGNATVNVSGNVELSANGKVVISGKGTVEIDGGSGAGQKPIHDASPCPLFGVCHLIPSMTVKISP